MGARELSFYLAFHVQRFRNPKIRTLLIGIHNCGMTLGMFELRFPMNIRGAPRVKRLCLRFAPVLSAFDRRDFP